MYTTRNFKSKKQLKEAVAAWNAAQSVDAENPLTLEVLTKAGVTRPQPVTYFQPGPFSGNEPLNGTLYLEGPHYPQPHRWYAQAEAKDGVIVKVK